MKAEGCLYSAYEILKTIRSQAGGINFDLYLDEMAQSKDSFRKLIQNERRLEFTFENHRYFDMRRWVLPLNEEVEGVAVTRNEDGTFSFKVQKYNPQIEMFAHFKTKSSFHKTKRII